MLSHARRKYSLDSQCAFCTHSAVFSLHFVSGLQSAFCTNRYPWHQYSLFLVTVIRTTHNLPQNTCVWVNSIDTFVLFRVNTLLSFCKNVDITYNVSSNPPTRKKIIFASIACLCFFRGPQMQIIAKCVTMIFWTKLQKFALLMFSPVSGNYCVNGLPTKSTQVKALFVGTTFYIITTKRQ